MNDEKPLIHYACTTTPLGPMLVAATPRGLCRIAFDDDMSVLVGILNADFPKTMRIESPTALAPFIAQIDAWLHGRRQHFELPLDLVVATPFQRRVWNALQNIPYGETRSYTQIAQTIGAPRAVRAVANACGANPVAPVIPCHRVVQKNGALAGYRWGVQRKAALLDMEAHAHPAI